jgi:hypothetical protein
MTCPWRVYSYLPSKKSRSLSISRAERRLARVVADPYAFLRVALAVPQTLSSEIDTE